MAFELTIEELQSFYSIDRELYTRLVTELGHNPSLAMRVVAFWLWSEEVGFPSVIQSLRNMPAVLVNAVFYEAVAILVCIKTESPPPETPLTTILMFKAVTFDCVYYNRHFAMNGVNRIVQKVCLRAFVNNDEEHEIIASPNVDPFAGQFADNGTRPIVAVQEAGRSMGTMEAMVPLGFPGGFGICAEPNVVPVLLLDSVGRPAEAMVPMAPMLPHGLPLNTLVLQDTEMKTQYEVGPTSTQMETVNNEEDLPLEDRTMFFTFSRGYHITELELHTYFLSRFGDVIEAIYMADTPPDTQPLYARVVFRLPSTVDNILNGRERVKFSINHKHVLCRRFVKWP